MGRWNERNGFTLVELLAVIVILAVLALVIVPGVNGIINNSKMESFRISVKGIYDAIVRDKAESSFSKNNQYRYEDTVLKKIKENGTDLSSAATVEVNGKIVNGVGEAIVTKQGKVLVAIQNGRYCAYNSYDDESIRVKKGNCDPIIDDSGWTPEKCFVFNEELGAITRYRREDTSCPTEVVIPEKIRGKEVKYIGNGAFIKNGIDDEQACCKGDILDSANLQCDMVDADFVPMESDGYDFCEVGPGTSVDRPVITAVDFNNATYLESIGDLVFVDDDIVLDRVNLSNLHHLKSIGAASFGDVKDSIVLSNLENLRSIGYGAFVNNAPGAEAPSHKNLVLENLPNLEKIGHSAFQGNSINGELSLPSARQIGAYAFLGTGITSLSLSNNLVSIGYGAFASNKLTSLTIPQSLDKIEEAAFYGNRIESLVVPGNIKTIGNLAFAENEMKSLILENGIETIGAEAFSWSYGPHETLNFIESLSIPSSVKTIGERAFAANQLTSLTFEEGIETIGEDAFKANLLTNVVLPNSLKTMGPYAFAENELNSVTLGTGLETIGNKAFYIHVHSGTPHTNANLTTIINPTLKVWDWCSIVGLNVSTCSFAEGTMASVGGKTLTIKGA